MRMLEEDSTPRFDLCFIDGAHSWDVDGFAFLLADRLLRANGWVIFDDLDWTYEGSPTMRDTEFVANMPEDERVTPQVARIYELLVKTQPGYGAFRIENNWAFAQKQSDAPLADTRPIRTETIYRKSILDHCLTTARQFARRMRGSRR